MKILIYIILFVAFLIPLAVLLALLLKSISFLINSFKKFRSIFISREEEKEVKEDVENFEEETIKEMDSIL
jgi:hypothetical protein